MDNLEFVFSLFNQYLFQDAKNNISALQYYFDTNYSTAGNKLVGELINAIKTYDLASIDLPLLNSVMMKTGKTPDESSKIINEIVKWKQFDRKQIEPARKFLEEVVAGSIIQKANNLFPNQPSEYLKYLKNAEYKTTSNIDILNAVGFNKIDINSIIAEQKTEGIESYFSFINQSFKPECRYEMGQLILIVSPPGTGKSNFLMLEALHMAASGHKCLYFAMGDISDRDFVVRMSAQYSGLPFWDAKNNLATIYNSLSQLVGDNLEISVVPAATVSVDEFLEFVGGKDYEVIFIDYDSNFKSDKIDQNMYLGYGEIYEKLTKLTLEGKLVFMASQPTKNSWGNEVIELNEVGESARKVHSSDVVITRGRVVGNPNHLGKFKIVKNRRGEEGIEVGSVRLNNGRFITVPDGVYSMLKQDTMPKNYTEADIEGMISRYNATMNQVRQKINQANQSQQRVSGPTPFGRP